MATHSDNPSSLQYRRLVADAAQRLSTDDRGRLVFVYELPPDDKEKNGIDILQSLMMQGHFSAESNPDGLVEVLRVAKRADIWKEAEKQIKKWRKAREKQEKKKATSEPAHSPPTDKLVMLKEKFDEIVEQATHLVDQLNKLTEQIQQEGEVPHKKANKLLRDCEESAEILQRSLKQARSAAELSDRALELKAQLQKQLENAVRKMPTSDMKDKVKDFVSGGELTCSYTDPPSFIATPTQGRAHDHKHKLPMPPPPREPRGAYSQAVEATQESASYYYEFSDLLKDKPHLKVNRRASLPPNIRPRVHSDSGSVSHKPIPTPRQRKDSSQLETKIPEWSHPSPTKPLKRQASDTRRYVNTREAVTSLLEESEDCTGSTGATGDSGFGDSANLLKVSLKENKTVYTPLQPDLREMDQGSKYETMQK